MNDLPGFFEKFFAVAFKPQTYLNLLYLLMAFPLGIFYFIVLIVGFSLGLPLLIIWVGILVLLFVFAAWWAFAAFERQLAMWLLQEDVPSMARPEPTGPRLWDKVVAILTNPVTWKSLLYLFAKFPLGIVSFTVLVTALAVPVTLMAAPFLYKIMPIQVDITWNTGWQIDTAAEAGIAFLIGLFLLFISLHLLNWLAWLSGRFAWIMLGNRPAAAAAPAAIIPTPVNPLQEEQNLPTG